MSQFNPIFPEFIEHRVLAFKFRDDSGRIMDHFLDQGVTEFPGIELRNLCAKVPAQFIDELEKRLDILGISKRQFIELSLHYCLNLVDAEIHRREVFEYLDAGGDPIRVPADEEVA